MIVFLHVSKTGGSSCDNHWHSTPASDVFGPCKCSGKHLLLKHHFTLVLALRNGGKVTKFSIKKEMIKINFQEGISRPHSGIEPSIKSTGIGCQLQTVGGLGE